MNLIIAGQSVLRLLLCQSTLLPPPSRRAFSRSSRPPGFQPAARPGSCSLTRTPRTFFPCENGPWRTLHICASAFSKPYRRHGSSSPESHRNKRTLATLLKLCEVHAAWILPAEQLSENYWRCIPSLT